MRQVFGRGINFAAQIDHTRKNYEKFVEIEELRGYQVLNIGCGYMQSLFFLNDGQVLKNGYILDTLLSARSFNYYRLMPRFFKLIQNIPVGKTLSYRGGDQNLTLLNKQLIINGVNITKAVFNQAGIHLLDDQQNMYVTGENYFGQRVTGDSLTKEDGFTKISTVKVLLDNKEIVERKITDIALGFQHSVFISEKGEAFGCGKAVDFQIQPYKYHHSSSALTIEKVQQPQLIYCKRKVVKAACGLKHTLLLTQNNKVMAVGNNKFGQCGINYLNQEEISKIQEVYFPLTKGQEIIDIKCGFYHSWILTNYHLYFTGSVAHNQNPFLSFQQNTGAFTITILPNNDKAIKIFTNFDRSAIITQKGKAYVFGGRDFSKKGGESGQLEQIKDFQFSEESLIGLGFSHTIIYQ